MKIRKCKGVLYFKIQSMNFRIYLTFITFHTGS
jgi:hypothetical protein